MKHPYPVSLAALLMAMSVAALPAFGSLVQLPPMESTAGIVQAPPSGAPLAKAAEPVRLELVPTAPSAGAPAGEATPADLALFVEGAVRDILGNATGVALLTEVTVPPPVAGMAKNLVAEPLPARATVRLSLSGVMAGQGGGHHLPVTLEVQREGKAPVRESFRVLPAQRDKAVAGFRTFLARHLPLGAPVAVPSAPATATSAAAAPRLGPVKPVLRLWMDNSDGGTVTLRSKLVIYWQASHSGYVSLYHFDAGGGVERAFPTRQMPENFVEAGRIYRFPASGHLTLDGPAGPQSFRAVMTLYPSNTSRQQPDGLSFRGEPLRVIPTHYPMLFANEDMSRIFALPGHLYTESQLPFVLKP
ncbi:DUF4384 domain-containing protein [Niveispirillum sp.]|uniref:DUF4384 domain-containing protein n=1 Tax=Niveispirillum sp. TaxID=1917217 RepID=UPI001B449913|nr:DUF4384 domain-containing protein [Niveispirillum sp.]MBP7335869.1 DUF4384 domain-containing protein [Niveispirillum sp.]